MKDPEFNPKQAAASFLQLVVGNKVDEAYQKYTSTDFIHHNPYFKGDRQSLLEAMDDNNKVSPGKSIEVKQVLQDGDKVAVHSFLRRHEGDPGLSVVHIFRFNHNKFTEIWDIGMELPATIVNEKGAF